jgi:hypothetical protein
MSTKKRCIMIEAFVIIINSWRQQDVLITWMNTTAVHSLSRILVIDFLN